MTLHVEWYDDWTIGNHFQEFGEAYADGEPDTCEMAVVKDEQGTVWASLGCIDNADALYRIEVENDLLKEAQAAWDKEANEELTKVIEKTA